MNSIITTEAVETAASIANVAPTLTNPVIASFKAMPTTAKVAMGVGAAGVVVGGGIIGYKVWRKHHPKTTPAKTNAPSGSLDDEADEFEIETEIEVEEEQIKQGEYLTHAHEMAVELTTKLYKAGFTDKGILMPMVCTFIESALDTEAGFKFIEAAVDAGIAAATNTSKSEGNDAPKDEDTQ